MFGKNRVVSLQFVYFEWGQMGFCCTLPASPPSSSIWEMSLFIFPPRKKWETWVVADCLTRRKGGCNGLQIPQGKGGSLKSRHGALVFLRAERQKGPRVGTGFIHVLFPFLFLCLFHVQVKLEVIIETLELWTKVCTCSYFRLLHRCLVSPYINFANRGGKKPLSRQNQTKRNGRGAWPDWVVTRWKSDKTNKSCLFLYKTCCELSVRCAHFLDHL